ncbi:hypothetical protein AGMMS49579_10940 [Spirochaetia bacterium]|nr:hypothetical protein AGMMS49579_10940 [Spirochaetia bacterium]
MRKFSLVLSLILAALMVTAALAGCKDVDDFKITGTTYSVYLTDASLTISGAERHKSYDGVISFLDELNISSSIATQLMADMTKQYSYQNGSGATRYVFVNVDNVGSISAKQVYGAGLNEDAILYIGIGFVPRQ